MIKELIDKIIDTLKVSNWMVETPSGFKDILEVHKTKKLRVCKIFTENYKLFCADKHIIIDEFDNEVYAKDLKVGDFIKTITGPEMVTKVLETNSYKNMYDISIDSEDHLYYTNGILSHNTTISSIYMLHKALFEPYQYIAILANKEPTSREILGRIQLAYRMLPYWLQQGIVEWNKQTIVLENGSKLLIGSTGSSSIRSKSISLLYIDEFAHILGHVADEFMDSVFPTIHSSKKSQLIIVSTPKGLNQFYNIWQSAMNDPDSPFQPIRVRWDEVPGRDEEFKKMIIAEKGKCHWAQEYLGQFVGSSILLINPDILDKIVLSEPKLLKFGGLLSIYEEPVNQATYILGIDASKGVGNDYSVIQVLRIISEEKIEQVAMYRNNEIDTYQFSQVCIEISKYYNEAYMMIENNAEGGEVCHNIWYNFEYDKIVNLDPKGIGIRSTKKSKLSALIFLKRYMDSMFLKINDKITLTELSRFEEISPNVFRANGNGHDDTVMALAWGLFFLSTIYFDSKKLYNIDERYKIEVDDTPLPFIINDNMNEDF